MAIMRKLTPLLMVLAVAASLPAMAQPRECLASPVLFSDDSFRGRSLALRDSIENLHSQGMGDDASSVCVPSGWRVILYQDTNFGGDALDLTGPVTISDLKRERPQGKDWGDRISAVRVYQPRKRLGRYQGQLPQGCDRYPVLFERDTFRGKTASLSQQIPDLHRQGMGDDASSVCVPEGWRVVVFEDTNYRGDRLEIYGPDAIQDLKRDRPEGKDWGDRISSVQVEQIGGSQRRPSEFGGVDKTPGIFDSRSRCRRYPTLFENYDYQGRYLELDDSVRDLRGRGFGDAVASVCVPSGYTVTFYEYSDYRGRSFQVAGDQEIPDLRRSRSGSAYWGDRFGSVQVYRSGADPYGSRDPDTTAGPCRDFPVLYSDDGFSGRSLVLRNSIRDLGSEGFSDSASSVCVPTGWAVVLYSESDFRGDRLDLSGGQSVSDLRRDRPGGQDWGDRISSVEIRRDWRR